jgi:hypothetical protein
MTDAYKLEFFVEDDGTEPVLAWIKNDLTAAHETVTQDRDILMSKYT